MLHTDHLQVFALTKLGAAYWQGDQRNARLQRVYDTVRVTREDLKAYQTRIAEAARRDHRKLGTGLDLFSFPDEIGSGLAVLHPNGIMVRMEMGDYSQRRHVEEGYQFAYTPYLTRASLFQTSGHLNRYIDGMYPPMYMDEERDAQNNIRRQGWDYYLKPMSCPMHNLIFRSWGRSYRELSLRLLELGTIYRDEKSGVVHGLIRARGSIQDDAYIYCTREQMCDELTGLLTFVLNPLKDYGLDDFCLELSTKNPKKFAGDNGTWEEVTNVLAEVATASGLEFVPDPGGTAFYGPKISVQAKGAIGHTWQMSTIQLDFNLPECLGLGYQVADGICQRPVTIHRALFGSIERLLGVLTEHYAGASPTWLIPARALGVPVVGELNDRLTDIAVRLGVHGVRAEPDSSDNRFDEKIRNTSRSRMSLIFIADGEDRDVRTASFHFRDGSQPNGVPVEQVVERTHTYIASRSNTDPGAR